MQLFLKRFPTANNGDLIVFSFLEVKSIITAEEVLQEHLFISHHCFELIFEPINNASTTPCRCN